MYHNAKLLKKSEALESALALSASGGLRDIAVSPAQGKFLHLHARAVGAKRILEIGTLGGCDIYVPVVLACANVDILSDKLGTPRSGWVKLYLRMEN